MQKNLHFWEEHSLLVRVCEEVVCPPPTHTPKRDLNASLINLSQDDICMWKSVDAKMKTKVKYSLFEYLQFIVRQLVFVH